MSTLLREFIVTLKDKNDLEQFYFEMENLGTTGFVPERVVDCVNKRPISRNTHYLLSADEVEELRKDPRVEAVSLRLKDLGIIAKSYAPQAGTWSRGEDIAVGDDNWGLYRCSLAANTSWGSETGTTRLSETLNVTSSGKNVDVVVVDEIAYAAHSEFNGRMNQYDWFLNHNAAVWPGNTNTNYTYTPYRGGNNHATHVAAIIGGETQGWARGANLYNLRHDTSDVNGTPGAYTPPEYVIDYLRAFHNSKSVNPATGRVNPTIANCSWGLTTKTNNPSLYTGGTNPRISKISYRGTLITPNSLGRTPVDTGYSGIANASTRVSTLAGVLNAGNRITTSGSSVGSVGSIALSLSPNTTGMTNLGATTNYDPNGVSAYDDGGWSITLPFVVTFLGGQFGPGQANTQIHVSTNSFVIFGGTLAQTYAYFQGAANPPVRKILVSAGDRSCQRLWSQLSGTTGSRTFKIRWEGHDGANGGVLGSPTTLWEMTFYEATPAQIDLHIGANANYRGEFTYDDLENYGILQTDGFCPVRDAAMDADVASAIADGIIFVGAAGNAAYKVDVPGGLDYDNYFLDNGEAIYYHRGSSPSASHADVICVGALDSTTQENKLQSANTGPRVDLYAPGRNVISAVFDDSGDPNGNFAGIVTSGGYNFQKYNGSSMAAAQVTGVLAVALETYPSMNQAAAKAYIIGYAKSGLMYSTSGGLKDSTDLQGGNNRILYYYKERPDQGVVFPKRNYKQRPSTGSVWPRPSIRRK
jgi:hypothetical protein